MQVLELLPLLAMSWQLSNCIANLVQPGQAHLLWSKTFWICMELSEGLLGQPRRLVHWILGQMLDLLPLQVFWVVWH